MLPQLDISVYTSQVFWLIVSLSILVILLNKCFIPRLNCSLDKRETFFKQEDSDIDVLENKLCEVETKIKNIEVQGGIRSSEIIRKAIVKSEENFENQLKVLRAENEELLDATRNRVRLDLKNLEDNIKQQISVSSELIFQKLVGRCQK